MPPLCHSLNGHSGFMGMYGLFWLGKNVTAACAGGLLTYNQLLLAHSSFC